MNKIRAKRIHEAADPGDGMRILVDRLWPRGMTRAAAKIDLWLKHAAPSDDLRRWFGHSPERWSEFRERYFDELDRGSASMGADSGGATAGGSHTAFRRQRSIEE